MAKSIGSTPSERYLAKLCASTFLSLWSYPNVFRDQRTGSQGDGKEVCDLLVVHGDSTILFSDKSCAFPNTGDLQTDWQRWYKRAIKKSADQLYGAQRWISKHPDRLFLDAACTTPLPIKMPTSDDCNFHLVVVALGALARCQYELNESGSLFLAPAITGDAHVGSNCRPFFVGDIDPSRTFVHVLDDVTLDIILAERDTVADFLAYLTCKEEFVRSGKLAWARGEENLLAHYLNNMNGDKHDLWLPAGYDQLYLENGHWQKYSTSGGVERKRQADEVSYLWDEIIERFVHHTLDGSTLPGSITDIAELESGLRIMSSESRFHRRILGNALRDMVVSTGQTQRKNRVMASPSNPKLAYVFMAIPDERDDPERHRRCRREFLHYYCFVLAWKYRQYETVLGIATEAGGNVQARSYDLVLVTSEGWTREDEDEAKRIQAELNILREENMTFSSCHADEYPTSSRIALPSEQLMRPDNEREFVLSAKPGRNSPCPCGSGKKFKRCCMTGRAG